MATLPAFARDGGGWSLRGLRVRPLPVGTRRLLPPAPSPPHPRRCAPLRWRYRSRPRARCLVARGAPSGCASVYPQLWVSCRVACGCRVAPAHWCGCKRIGFGEPRSTPHVAGTWAPHQNENQTQLTGIGRTSRHSFGPPGSTGRDEIALDRTRAHRNWRAPFQLQSSFGASLPRRAEGHPLRRASPSEICVLAATCEENPCFSIAKVEHV